jgi:hypothetical protein
MYSCEGCDVYQAGTHQPFSHSSPSRSGPCGTDTGKPGDVESKYPITNIKRGGIGSTFTHMENSVPSGPVCPSTTSRLPATMLHSSVMTSDRSTTSTRTSTTSSQSPNRYLPLLSFRCKIAQ